MVAYTLSPLAGMSIVVIGLVISRDTPSELQFRSTQPRQPSWSTSSADKRTKQSLNSVIAFDAAVTVSRDLIFSKLKERLKAFVTTY